MFLRRPWRWPELWGMNMQAIANPHLIYPGQVLYLDKRDGYARLSTARPMGDGGEPGVVRVSPSTRSESLAHGECSHGIPLLVADAASLLGTAARPILS